MGGALEPEHRDLGLEVVGGDAREAGFDPLDARLGELVGRVLGDLGGAFSVPLVRIGDGLGLYGRCGRSGLGGLGPPPVP